MSETKIILRHVTASDKNELVSLMVKSQEFHSPWIQSPNSGPMFEAYLKRIKRSDHEGFAVCRASDSALVGVINVNNIVRGSLLTASLGYYVGHSFQGEGYMSAGLKSLVQYAFTTMGLHRLEANIQPGNVKSINMVKRHVKPTKENKGGIISKENYIHQSNVKNIDVKKTEPKKKGKK